MTKKGRKPALFLDDEACYAAFCAHDARLDGKIFIGVSSTGVYCRPICRARQPKPENCAYFISAAAAEAAGYRPCLRCRPELAPGLAPIDASAQIAQQVLTIIEEEGAAQLRISGLAEKLGVSERHLRRFFSAEYGVSPVQYLQTFKLLLAKNLLTDTGLSVTEIAMAAGFGSIRRFNELFKKHYGMSPSSLRKIAKNAHDGQAITLMICYRPPYAWDKLLAFLSTRAVPGVESVADGAYRRTVALQKGGITYRGWISVTNKEEKNSVLLTVAPSLLPVLAKVLARVRHLFDLNSEPLEIYEKLKVMNELSANLYRAGTRVPGCFDPFELSVRAILGQQVTVKAARTLAQRFVTAFGDLVHTPFEDLGFTFPVPASIYGLKAPPESLLGPLGITGARARSIFALAEALIRGEVTLAKGADPENEMNKLLELPGFGPWTVQYIGMRALGWPDAFPYTDLGVRKALKGMSTREILALSQAWRPWRSYATVSLWNSLEEHNQEEMKRV